MFLLNNHAQLYGCQAFYWLPNGVSCFILRNFAVN